MTEAFGQLVILKVHFDHDPDAPALGLASYEWAVVAVEPLAHIRHQITKGGSSSHNFNHPHRKPPRKCLPHVRLTRLATITQSVFCNEAEMGNVR